MLGTHHVFMPGAHDLNPDIPLAQMSTASPTQIPCLPRAERKSVACHLSCPCLKQIMCLWQKPMTSLQMFTSADVHYFWDSSPFRPEVYMGVAHLWIYQRSLFTILSFIVP